MTARRCEYRLVLDRRSNQMIAWPEQIQRDVVRFRCAGGEVDLIRLRTEKTRDGDARVLDRIRRAASVLVRERGRIAEDRREERQHRVDDPRIAGRRGVMIEIDGWFRHRPP